MIMIMNLPHPFSQLPKTAFRDVAFKRGDLLFSQGQEADGPGFMLRGSAELVRHTKDGQRVILFRAFEGETIAEAALFSPTYHCDCIATKAGRIVVFDKAAIMATLETDPKFMRAYMHRMAEQVITYRRRLEIAAIPKAEPRIMAALESFGQPQSVAEFAQSIGLTNEATLRALKRLIDKRMVERTGRGRYRLL